MWSCMWHTPCGLALVERGALAGQIGDWATSAHGGLCSSLQIKGDWLSVPLVNGCKPETTGPIIMHTRTTVPPTRAVICKVTR